MNPQLPFTEPTSTIPTNNNDNAPTSDVQIVTFPPGDPTNPRNFSPARKWAIVASIAAVDLTVSWGASGYSPASMDFAQDFGVSSEVGTLGLALYVLGLALGPMTLAPLSEHYGRTPLYVLPYAAYLLLLLGTALVQNLGGFLVLRILSGIFSSVTIANFGGTIADLWPRDAVGPAMSLFLWAAVCGSPMGFFLFAFVAGTRTWRDVFWALLGCSGGLWLVMAVVLVGGGNETRHAVLLRRRAAQLRKAARDGDGDGDGDGGNSGVRFDVPEEMREKSLPQLFRVTLSRPFRFLATETIVVLAALYNGYLYGLTYLFNGAFSLVFGEKGYGFSTIGVGLAFLGFVLGVSTGPITNIWQERHYQRRIRGTEKPLSAAASEAADYPSASQQQQQQQQQQHSQHQTTTNTATASTTLDAQNIDPANVDRFANIPEARVQLGKLAGLTFPISLFWFAWTSVPSYHIHWMVPILATALFGWSFYTLILMTYVYVEDSYMVYSASALAGVGLVRNLAGAGFPLFGAQLFENEGYNWAGTILACLALLLAPIPFVLERYGDRLRRRSPYARQHMDHFSGGHPGG